MTKAERIHLIGITARLEAVIEGLNNANSPIGRKESICIICEQITALHDIIDDILKGGAINEGKGILLK